MSWFGDFDARGIFLNYPLYRDIRTFAVVGISWIEDAEEVGGKGGGGIKWQRWKIMTMGILSYPWVTTQLFVCTM